MWEVERIHQRQGDLRTVELGNRDGTVQGDHGGRAARGGDDRHRTGLASVLRTRMTGIDTRREKPDPKFRGDLEQRAAWACA